ncbi:MAG: MoaD/ThiS family protein [Chloracidobacterium sp.]|nr:MoaD/ThiS family protein [Chloracidobacterium sp.]
MALTVYLSGHLRSFSNGELEVPLSGDLATVGDALEMLWRIHPALRDRVLNEQGEIRTHVNVFVGSDDVKRRRGLETPLTDKQLHIFNAVSGG